MIKMFHATPYDNLYSILRNGIKTGIDGVVYLCERPEDAVKFLAIRGIRDIAVFEVKIPKKLDNTLIESFDHSIVFFKCRAYMSKIDIEPSRLGKIYRYEL